MGMMKGKEQILKELAGICETRMNEAGMVGQAREERVIEFWIGAAFALEAAGHKDANSIGTFVATQIAVRGDAVVKELLNLPVNSSPTDRIVKRPRLIGAWSA